MRSTFFSRCQRFLQISVKFSLAFGLVLFLSAMIAPQEVKAQYSVLQVLPDGASHTCALLTTQEVVCWGYNSYGLGDGSTTSSTTPIQIHDISDVKEISLGGSNTCALLNTGSVQCWGRNTHNQIGDGTTINRTTPTQVIDVANAKAIASGNNHTCVVLETGEVKCWGYNSYGLGDGSTISSATPIQVTGIADAIEISANNDNTCALLETGEIMCWGYNYYGQIGDGTTKNSQTPVKVGGITNAKGVSVGDYHACALLNDGGMRCWGRNSVGQLGNGSTNTSTVPVAVSLTEEVIAMDIGGHHSCALFASGKVKCWGSNLQGELGINSSVDYRMSPVEVYGLTGVSAISAGEYASCAIVSSGAAKCWGYNYNGSLGDGTTVNRRAPVDVISIDGTGPTPLPSPTITPTPTPTPEPSPTETPTPTPIPSPIIQPPSAPEFSDGIDPNDGTETTNFTFKAVYSHPDGTPGTIDLVIEKKDTNGDFQPYDTYQMQPEEQDPDYVNGAVFVFTNDDGFPEGEYRFSYSVNDGAFNVAGQVFAVTAANVPPTIPTDLGQLNANTSLAIPTGVNNHIGPTAAENTVVFSGYVSDPDGDQVQLQVEVRKVGEAFDDTDDTTNDFLTSPLVESGELATTAVFTATPGDYHWRARTIDANGNEGEWVEFGDNPTDDTDFDYGFEPHPYVFTNKNYGIDLEDMSGDVVDNIGTLLDRIIEGDTWDIFREAFDLSELDTQTQMRLFQDFDLSKNDKFGILVKNNYFGKGGTCYGLGILALMQYIYPQYIDFHYPAFNQLLASSTNQDLIGNLPEPSTKISILGKTVFDAENLSAKPVLKTILTIHLSQFGRPYQIALRRAQTNPVQILDTIRTSLSGPVNDLYVLRVLNRSVGAHLLIPYRVEQDRIYVADTNYPDDNSRFITVTSNTANGAWNYDMGGRLGYWSSGDTEMRLVSIKDLYNNGKKPLPFGISESETSLSLIGNANLLLSDDEGRLTGIQENGEQKFEIPDIDPVYEVGVLPDSEANPLQQKYFAFGDTTALQITATGTEEGKYSITKISADQFVALENVSTAIGIADTFTFASNATELQFSQEVVEGRTYNITLNKNINGESVTFSAINIPVNPSATHKYTPDWQALAAGDEGITLEIDEDGDGTIDQTIVSDADLTGIEITDTTAPTTTLTLDGTTNPDGSYIPDATATLIATDETDGSGIAFTEYSLDDGATWTPYTDPIVFNTIGTYTLLYRSTDNADNIEADQSETIVIAVAPTPTPTPTPEPTSTPTPTPNPNLLTNAGFETDTDWQKGFWTSSKGTITRTTSTKHSGSYSYMIDGDTNTSGGQVYSNTANQVSVTPGTRYQYSAWYKGNNAYLVIKWFNSSGTELSSARNNFGLENTSAWTEAVKEAIAPTGATTAWVFVQSRSNSAPVYFDDLEFVPLAISTPSALTNPSFETQDGWLKGFWTSSKGTIARVTSTKHSGSYSYMIDGDTNSSGGQVYSDTANLLAVTPGQDYRFSAWYKGKNIYLVIKWLDANGNELTSKRNNIWQPNSTSWKQATANVTAPTGATKAWLFVQTRDNAEPVYFDDLEFEEVE